jgi:hypothetical protein
LHRVNNLWVAILEKQADQEAAAMREDAHDEEHADEED